MSWMEKCGTILYIACLDRNGRQVKHVLNSKRLDVYVYKIDEFEYIDNKEIVKNNKK